MNLLLWSFVVVGVLALLPLGGLTYRALRQRRVRQALAIHTQSAIVERRFVTIGGIDQWIQIRGEDRANPILLIVHGHGLAMGAFAPLLRSWEQHFTVAQWDRRGVGQTRSLRGKAGSETWTLDLLAEDGVQVTEFLCQHLRQQKVILIGHSQGSAIALLMLKRRPDLFHAYVGTGQIVDMQRNEAISYATAIERAQKTNNTKALKALEGIGAPPYPKVQTWLIKQRWGQITDPEMGVWQPLALRMVLSASTYSLSDVYHAFNDVLFLPQHLYEAYMAFDAQRLGTRFDMPFFIFQGDSDVLTPTALAEAFVATVAAPTSGLALLKGSSHMALLTQPDQFLQELLARVRPLVTPKASEHLGSAER